MAPAGEEGGVIRKDDPVRDARFAVRAVSALDILFPRVYRAVGRLLAWLPRWLTWATKKEQEILRREFMDDDRGAG